MTFHLILAAALALLAGPASASTFRPCPITAAGWSPAVTCAAPMRETWRPDLVRPDLVRGMVKREKQHD